MAGVRLSINHSHGHGIAIVAAVSSSTYHTVVIRIIIVIQLYGYIKGLETPNPNQKEGIVVRGTDSFTRNGKEAKKRGEEERGREGGGGRSEESKDSIERR